MTLNPRWVCWLASRGEDPANQPESTIDEPVYVVDPPIDPEIERVVDREMRARVSGLASKRALTRRR